MSIICFMVEEFRGKEVYPRDNLSYQKRLEEARMAIKKSPKVHSIRLPFLGGFVSILSALEPMANPYALRGERITGALYLNFQRRQEGIAFWVGRKPQP